MRVRSITTVVLFGICLVNAAPAHAFLGDGWFERLSGPGPFTGINVELSLVCVTSFLSDQRLERNEIETMRSANPVGWRATFPRDSDAERWFTLLGCHFLPRDQPRLELGFQYRHMSADGERNLLDYSHRPGVTAEDKDVRFNSFMLTADVRVNRIVEVGAAIGRGSFSSPAGLFDSFSKLVFQPIRVTIHPLSPIAKHSRLAELLLIRGDGTMFKGGFTDSDFAANPGSFSEPGEFVWGWSVVFDLSTIFWRNVGQR